jgi:hypothetical protein
MKTAEKHFVVGCKLLKECQGPLALCEHSLHRRQPATAPGMLFTACPDTDAFLPVFIPLRCLRPLSNIDTGAPAKSLMQLTHYTPAHPGQKGLFIPGSWGAYLQSPQPMCHYPTTCFPYLQPGPSLLAC